MSQRSLLDFDESLATREAEFLLQFSFQEFPEGPFLGADEAEEEEKASHRHDVMVPVDSLETFHITVVNSRVLEGIFIILWHAL